MGVPQAAALSPILLVVGALLFVLLFAVILQALKMSSFFSGGVSYLMATCVSLLCVFSLFRAFVDERVISKGGKGEMVDFILLPYAALAIAIMLVRLFLGFGKAFGTGGYRILREPDHPRGNIAGSTFGALRVRKVKEPPNLRKTGKRASRSTDIRGSCDQHAITSRRDAKASRTTIRSTWWENAGRRDSGHRSFLLFVLGEVASG